jgi:DHA2 family multidrug resistance protein
MTSSRWRSFRDRLQQNYPQLQSSNPNYKWLVLGSVMIVTFMAVLDATIVNVAISKLMSSFGVSVDEVEWVLTAYLLIFGVVLPTSGWLADHWGSKLVFSLGLILFTVGSFLCSLAWDLHALIIFRIIQGAGAGLVMPVGLAIITREFPPEKRGIALAFWTVSASASVSLGPAMGGYLIDNYSWHAIFDINVPIGIFGLAVIMIVLREQKAEISRRFDYLGFVTMSVGLATLLLAFASGNSAWNTGGWTSTYILSCFAISVVSLTIFLITELTVEHPLIELSLFRYATFTVTNGVAFLFGLALFGSTFLLPIYLQDSLGYTPLQAGLVFIPVGIIQGFVAPIAGLFSDRYSPKLPAFIGMVLMAVTFYLLGHLSFLSEKPQIMLPLYIRGVSIGLIFAPLTAMALSEISHKEIAQASGLLNVIRQIGGSFGVAVFGSLLTRRTIYHMAIYGQQINPQSDTFHQTVAKLQGHVMQTGGIPFANAGPQAKALIGSFVSKQAFIQAIDDVYLAAAVIILIGAFPVLFIRMRKRKAPQPGAPQKPTSVAIE